MKKWRVREGARGWHGEKSWEFFKKFTRIKESSFDLTHTSRHHTQRSYCPHVCQWRYLLVLHLAELIQSEFRGNTRCKTPLSPPPLDHRRKVTVWGYISLCKCLQTSVVRQLLSSFVKIQIQHIKMPQGKSTPMTKDAASRYRITINVPVVYMTRRNDFDAGKSVTRTIGRGDPTPVWVPPLSNRPSNGFAPIKFIKSKHHIKKTGALVYYVHKFSLPF